MNTNETIWKLLDEVAALLKEVAALRKEVKELKESQPLPYWPAPYTHRYPYVGPIWHTADDVTAPLGGPPTIYGE